MPVVFGAGELVILLAWAVLFAILWTYRYTLGALILKLADMVDDIWVVGGPLSDALEKLDHVVQASIGVGLKGLEQASAKVWASITWTTRALGDAVLELGAAGHALGEAIVGAVIPNHVKAATAPLAGDIARTRTAGRAADAAEAAARARGIDALRRDVSREILARQRGIDELRRTLSDLINGRVHGLERDVAQVREWAGNLVHGKVGSLEQRLAAGAIGAAAVAAMTRVFPYWQCSNVRRFNRMLCRSPIGALDELLGLATLFVGPLSIVALAGQVQEITEGTRAGVGFFVTELRD